MNIKRITLTNFRNYKNESASFGDNVNVIYGDNAQGKTNLIEAVYMFAFGKSYRTTSVKDMIQFGSSSAKINLEFKCKNRDMTSEIVITGDKKKHITVNGVSISRISELMGYLNIVLFCPEELEIIKSGPSMRRKFVNMLISQLRPAYFTALCRYSKILDQRNSLLKQIKLTGKGAETLFVWDEKLVNEGKRIIKYRKEFISKLSDLAGTIHREITDEDFTIEYDISIDEDEFESKLESNRNRDIEFMQTAYGPHRDDINIKINGKSIKNFGSQGQQRTAVLVLKLAQAELIFNETGEYPVLLLDDIMSELDLSRRNYLLNKISDKQVIITCTDADSLPFKNNNVHYIYVENGTVEQKGE